MNQIKPFNRQTFARDLQDNIYTLDDIPKILSLSQIKDIYIRACLDARFGNKTVAKLINDFF